jgi:large subunit ribosomal protein L21
LEHGKEEKVLVFKFKRKKNYRRLRGHRQPFTDLQIGEIRIR